MNYFKFAQQLLTDGYICIPITDLKEKLVNIRYEIDLTIKSFPEFKSSAIVSNGYVCGGFSALGNAASFHNPIIRFLRQLSHATVIPLFKELNNLYNENYQLEQIIDRFFFRPIGKSPSRETFHRDIASNMLEKDKIFGGWICLDDQSQYFSCIRGSHLESTNNMQGFAKISKNEVIALRNNPNKTKVEVKPGEILIFFENIIHEVLPSKLNYNMYRLGTAWRLTHSSTSLIPDINDILQKQAVVPIKSGQHPPIYPRLYLVNWIDKLQEWSLSQVKDEFLETYTPKSGKNKDKNYKIVNRFMRSLADIGMMYESYSNSEIQLYHPSKIC